MTPPTVSVAHVHSLPGGEVEAVEDIPNDEDGAHVAEDDAVEAQRHQQRQEQQVQAFPELKGHLRFSSGDRSYVAERQRFGQLYQRHTVDKYHVFREGSRRSLSMHNIEFNFDSTHPFSVPHALSMTVKRRRRWRYVGTGLCRIGPEQFAGTKPRAFTSYGTPLSTVAKLQQTVPEMFSPTLRRIHPT